MQYTPILSVISPVYNSSKYLDKCINSIINQSLKNVQIIFVDDGSEDDSKKIINDYSSKDARILLIEQKNLGAGPARNNGLKYATGKYVHFLDSDDWLEPTAYETIINKLESSGCDTCIFQKYYYDNVTGEVTPSIRAFRTNNYITNFENNPSFFIHSPVVPWNKITRRDVIEKYKIRYDEIACGNDRTFYFHLIKSCRSIMVCRDLLLYYRVNNSKSTVGTNRSIHFDAHFKAYESTMSKYRDSPEDIQRMVADACFVDFFFFFDKSETRFKKKIYSQLHDFFCNADLDIFHDEFKNYSWGKRMEYVRDHPDCPPEYLLDDPKQQEKSVPSPRDGFERPNLKIIVSLTSFPARIETVNQTIESILSSQSVKADRVILWLADSQFPSLEKELPEQLINLKKEGLEIRFCDDLKPHKKYFYAMQENPDSIIITIDDDLIYAPDTIESLLTSYSLFPKCVSARRVHRIQYSEGNIAPYSYWGLNDDTFYHNPSMLAIGTGVGGILYPPHLLPKDTFDIKAITDTCLFADDLWLKANEIRAGIPTVLSSFNGPLEYVDGSQEVALWKDNKDKGANDVQLGKIISYFREKGDLILNNVYEDHLEKYPITTYLVECTNGIRSKDVIELKNGCNTDIILYNINEKDIDELNKNFYLDKNVVIIYQKDKKIPLYAAAEISKSSEVVCIFSDEIMKKLEKIQIERKILIDLKIPVIDEFSTSLIELYLGKRQSITLCPGHITPKKYSKKFINNIRTKIHVDSVKPGVNLSQSEYEIVDSLVNGTDYAGITELDESDLIDHRRICPICGNYTDSFIPAGTRLRDNVICQKCGSYERHRALWAATRMSTHEGDDVLCINYPPAIELLIKRNGICTCNLDEIDNVKEKFDVISLVIQPNKTPDVNSLFKNIASRLKSNGTILMTLPINKMEENYRVSDTPMSIDEFRWLLERHGLDTRIAWNKDVFTIETMELYGLVQGETMMICRPLTSYSIPTASPTISRMQTIAENYSNGQFSKRNSDMICFWYECAEEKSKSDMKNKIMDALWISGTSESIEKLRSIVEIKIKNGSLRAAFYMGKMYQTGRGLKKNLRAAIEWFRKISDKDEDAKYELCLTLTFTLKQDDLNEFFSIAERTDDGRILFLASKILYEGKLAPINKTKSISYLEKSYKAGYEKASDQLIDYYWENPNNSNNFKLISLCSELADSGNTRATYYLMKICTEGRGTKTDLRKTQAILSKNLSKLDDKSIEKYLELLYKSESYDEMKDVAEKFDFPIYAARAYSMDNKDKAINYYRRALTTTGKKYWDEYLDYLWKIGTPDTDKEYYDFCQNNYRSGNENMRIRLAICYDLGRGIEQDCKKSISSLRDVILSNPASEKDLVYKLWKSNCFKALTAIGDMCKDPSSNKYLARAYAIQGKIDEACQWYDKAFKFEPEATINEYSEILLRSNKEETLSECWAINKEYSKKGNKDALFHLGLMYKDGKFVEKNLDESRSILKKAMEKGSSQAAKEYCKLVFEEISIKNDEKAFEELLSMAKSEENIVAGYVSLSYYTGKGTTQDFLKAREWLKRSDGGNTVLRYARDSIKDKNLNRLILKDCADAGNPHAQYMLMKIYISEKNTNSSKELADRLKDYYEKTIIEEPNQVIFEYTGLLLSTEDYTDKVKCLELCKKFSKMNNKDSLYRLGTMYRDGIIVEKDNGLAEYYFKRAIEAGSKLAANEVNITLNKEDIGESTSVTVSNLIASNADIIIIKNIILSDLRPNAEKWLDQLEELANKAHPEIAYEVGKAYRFGNKTQKDLISAAECLRIASKHNYSKAYPELFDILWNMQDPEKYQEMLNILNDGITRNDPECIGRMGRMYKFGKGLPKNINHAKKWFSKAAKLDPKWQDEINALKC